MPTHVHKLTYQHTSRLRPNHQVTMPYICKTCCKSFRKEGGVISHCKAKGHARLWRFKQLKSDAHPFSCQVCNMTFRNVSALNQHLNCRDVHINLASLTGNTFCNICKRKFRRPEDLAQHNASSIHGIFEFPRILSQPVIPRNPNHVTTAVPLHSGQSFKCPKCSKKFGSFQALQGHSVDDGNEFTCPRFCYICEKKFKRPEDLARHNESSVHATRSQRSRLEDDDDDDDDDDTTTVQMPNTAPFQCPVCFKTFQALEYLQAHLNSPLNNGTNFQCIKCNSSFELVCGLVQHLETTSCSNSMVDIEGQLIDMAVQFSSLSMS